MIMYKDDLMEFYKSIYKKEVVLTISNETIDDKLSLEILKNIDNNKRTGLDMKHVKTIKSKKFIKYLLDNRFFLFNLRNEVMCYLAIILKDGFLKSFLNCSDFLNNKRELIRRRISAL